VYENGKSAPTVLISFAFFVITHANNNGVLLLDGDGGRSTKRVVRVQVAKKIWPPYFLILSTFFFRREAGEVDFMRRLY